MNPFSIRIIELPCGSQRHSKVLAIYLLRPEFSEDSFDGALAQALTSGSQFDAVHIVGFSDCIKQAHKWLRPESSIYGRLELATANLEGNIKYISFDETNGKHTIERLDGKPVLDAEKEIEAHKRHNLASLFISNNGQVTAPQGFHYVKPSRKHVGMFLRTANVLEQSESAYIISFWAMPQIWKRNIELIVIDTSGISDVALTLAYEALCRNGIAKLPIIHSHQSYSGLQKLEITRPNETLILISASTSGGLKNELVNLGAIEDQIITLFYLGDDTHDAGRMLCNLTKESPGKTYGISPIENFSAEDCPYCRRKSYPVPLEGDQFAFEPPKVEEIMIALTDLSPAKQQLFDQLAGIDFFKVYRNFSDRSLEIFLNTKSLFSKSNTEYRPTQELLNRLQQRWSGLVLRGSPINLKRIIHTTYPFSGDIAEAANGLVSSHHPELSNLQLSSRELRAHTTPSPKAAALVVTACIDDSHELMAINRDLRAIHPQGNTTYISPIFRADSNSERARIKSNLTFGENGANTFSLHSLIDLDLPEENNNHSWGTELTMLRNIVDWADFQGRDIPPDIAKRVLFLETVAPTQGISEELFWPDCNGRSLRIRSDFTLLSTEGGTRSLSQADIFVVVSAVIHSLRQGVPGKPKLAYMQYERAVLSPDIFDRFNDGIIQSALLRAARGYEFAYANCDKKISDRMKNFVLSYIEKAHSGEGEALAEFLLALTCGRMTLHKEHIDEIVAAINNQAGLPSHFHLFADYLKTAS